MHSNPLLCTTQSKPPPKLVGAKDEAALAVAAGKISTLNDKVTSLTGKITSLTGESKGKDQIIEQLRKELSDSKAMQATLSASH